MPYDLDIKIEEHFLYASIAGLRSREAISSAITEIGEACREHQTERVLIDVRKLTGRIPIFDSLSLIFNDFPPIKKSTVVKRAAIVEAEIRRVRFTFFERVARNRDYDVRVFTDPETAVKWLCEDQSTDPIDE